MGHPVVIIQRKNISYYLLKVFNEKKILKVKVEPVVLQLWDTAASV